ncbi:hypothetical protein ADUPG1_005582, partial [Aduncisulcus paluster]
MQKLDLLGPRWMITDEEDDDWFMEDDMGEEKGGLVCINNGLEPLVMPMIENYMVEDRPRMPSTLPPMVLKLGGEYMNLGEAPRRQAYSKE